MPKSPQAAYSRPQPPLYNTLRLYSSCSGTQHTVSGSHLVGKVNPDFLLIVCASDDLDTDPIAIIVGQQVKIMVDGELSEVFVLAFAGRQHCFNLFDVVGAGRFAGRVGTLATHISQPYVLSDPWDNSTSYPLVISDTKFFLFTYIPKHQHFYVSILRDSHIVTRVEFRSYPRPEVYCVKRSA